MSAHTAPLRVLDLFSGIGGFSLGLERAGMETVAFCEIEPYCRAVLKRHWPHVPIYDDIRTLTVPRGAADVVCGGFPCQPFSSASRGRLNGRNDDRYLWPEMLRVVRECQPTWVIGENVAHLRGVDFDTVVTDLEREGYEVQTLEIPACATGHDHWRARLWFLGYTDRNGKSGRAVDAEASGVSWARGVPARMGTAHGLPRRLDGHRLRAIGNAVVPQIPEMIGRAILAAQKEGRAEARPEITALASTCQD